MGEATDDERAELADVETATGHLRAAAHALVRGELRGAAYLDEWIALHLILTALRKRDSPAALAVRELVRKHGKDAEHVYCDAGASSLGRTRRAERIGDLRVALAAALATVDEAPPWSRAAAALSEWGAHNFDDALHEEDALACDEWVTLRFLARVALALPKRQREELRPLADRALALSGAGTRDAHDTLEREIATALDLAWEAARPASKSIREADAGWFLARALEAMHEDPHARTATERKRDERANRAKAKKKAAARKKL